MSLIEKALRQLEKDKHTVSYGAYPGINQPVASHEVYEKADAASMEFFTGEQDEPRPRIQLLIAGVVLVLVVSAAAAWYMQQGGQKVTEKAVAVPQLKDGPVTAAKNTGSARAASAPNLQRDESRAALNATDRLQAVKSGAQRQSLMSAASHAAQDDAASMKKRSPSHSPATAPLKQAAAIDQAAPSTVQTPRAAGASQAQRKEAKKPPGAVNARTANLLQQEAENADSLNNTGVILLEKGDAAQARDYFAKALRLDPGHERALNNLGLSLYAQGRVEEALRYYQQALKVNPDNIETCVNMGIALRSRGNFKQAAEIFQKALALNPEHPETLYNYGLLLKDMGQQDKARACFEQFVKIAPPHLLGVADSVRKYLQASPDKEQ